MIYYVTNQCGIPVDSYQTISVKESLELLKDCTVLQADSETTGLDPHLNKILCFQLGNRKRDFQIVIDCTTVDITIYKDILENTLLIFHNGKFDLQFLYNHYIIPRNVYDTMIVEQLLHLGYPKGVISYSLASVAYRRLNVDIDKSIRGQIIWKGLTEDVINYAANDVKWLEDIVDSQIKDCKEKQCLVGAKLECDTVPVMAYLEWCGIKLDEEKWKAKMAKDKANLDSRKKALDDWLINICNTDNLQIEQDRGIVTIGYTPYNDEEYKKYLEDKKVLESFGYTLINKDLIKSEMGGNSYTYKSPYKITDIVNLKKEYIYIDNQGDLFSGFSLEPKVTINWDSSKQVVQVAKALGFNTTVQDKKTGEDKDSVLEKQLASQKGINDEFLKLYFDYKESSKLVTTYGQGHLNIINPITGRIHTVYHQLGASSSRMSCGSTKPNEEIAKLRRVLPKECTMPNLQQLPHDTETRACFVSEPGNLFCSCDYSSQEGRTQAEIYNEKVLIDMYNNNLDSHSVNAKIFFKDELKDIDVKDIKKLRPDLRQAAKAPFFALSYGGSYQTLMSSLGIDENTAKTIVANYESGYKDTMEFAKKASKFVRENGYIVINPKYGHKLYWWDFKKWQERQKSFTQEFWEEYRTKYKGTLHPIALEVKQHFQAVSKYDRLARNAPSQGTSAIMTKLALIDLFKWILDNNYFNKVKIVNVTHDEINTEYPETLEEFPKILQDIMSKAGKSLCKKVDVPAEAAVDTCWRH